jgi:ABC-2 type transport system permease protein
VNWQQLKTILWLRWRLSRNQWSRGGTLNAVLTVVLSVTFITLAIGGGIGGLFAGALGLAQAPPPVMLLIWDVIIGLFLFFWMLGFITEIQRAETIDIGRLLHLPISLNGVFAVNYLASHFSFAVILFVPVLIGLAAGLVVGRGAAMLLMFPLVISFVFMITAWVYCLRGWLVALMVNPRRRRAIIVGITTAFIVLGQLPNFYFNVIQGGYRKKNGRNPSVLPATPARAQPERDLSNGLLVAHQYIPPLWLANGAMALSQMNPWPAVWGSLGAFAIGGVGLHRAYQSTIRFYQGNQPGQRIPEKRPEPDRLRKQSTGRNFLAHQLRGVPEEAAAMALGSLRSMVRAPEIKMALASSFIAPLVVGTMLFSGRSGPTPPWAKPFIATGAVVFVLFAMVQLLFNQFGFDREGFRALVLLPAPRKYILLGKNLAFVPFAVGMAGLFLIGLKLGIQLSWGIIVAALFQFLATFLFVCIAGNFASIVAPYRISAGSLKPTKTTAKARVVLLVSHLLFPIAMLPICIPPVLERMFAALEWLPLLPVNLMLSVALFAGALGLYRVSLPRLGTLMEQREKEMLQVITQEIE